RSAPCCGSRSSDPTKTPCTDHPGRHHEGPRSRWPRSRCDEGSRLPSRRSRRGRTRSAQPARAPSGGTPPRTSQAALPRSSRKESYHVPHSTRVRALRWIGHKAPLVSLSQNKRRKVASNAEPMRPNQLARALALSSAAIVTLSTATALAEGTALRADLVEP